MFPHKHPTWIYTSPLHALPLNCNNKCQNDVLHSYTSAGHSCLTRAVSGLWVKKVSDFVCKEQQQSESAAGNETCSLKLNLCPEFIYIHNLVNCTATPCGHNAEIQFAVEKNVSSGIKRAFYCNKINICFHVTTSDVFVCVLYVNDPFKNHCVTLWLSHAGLQKKTTDLCNYIFIINLKRPWMVSDQPSHITSCRWILSCLVSWLVQSSTLAVRCETCLCSISCKLIL